MATAKENYIKAMEEELNAFIQTHKLDKFPIIFLNEFDIQELLGTLSGDGTLHFVSYRHEIDNRQRLLELAVDGIPFIERIIKRMNEEISVEVAHYNDYEVDRTEQWTDTFHNICEKFERANSRLRYINGSFYKFKDEQMQRDYYCWYNLLDGNEQFKLYYGNGIVD